MTSVFIRKSIQEKLGSSKNVIFLLKIVYLAFRLTPLPRISNLTAPGGTLPPCPLNISYFLEALNF